MSAPTSESAMLGGECDQRDAVERLRRERSSRSERCVQVARLRLRGDASDLLPRGLGQRRQSLDRLGRTQGVVDDDVRDARHVCVAERFEELRPVVAVGQQDEHPSLRVDHPLHPVDEFDAALIGLGAGERRSSRPPRSTRPPVPRRPPSDERTTESVVDVGNDDRRHARVFRDLGDGTRLHRVAGHGAEEQIVGREDRRGSAPRRSGNTPPHRLETMPVSVLAAMVDDAGPMIASASSSIRFCAAVAPAAAVSPSSVADESTRRPNTPPSGVDLVDGGVDAVQDRVAEQGGGGRKHHPDRQLAVAGRHARGSSNWSWRPSDPGSASEPLEHAATATVTDSANAMLRGRQPCPDHDVSP